jgi:averantin hydroxylase
MSKLPGADGIVVASTEVHQRQRQALAPGFSTTALVAQEFRIQMYVDQFISQVAQDAPSGPLNMAERVNWAIFDVIGDLGFGESFGCLENRHTHPWILNLTSLTTMLVWLTAINRYGLSRLMSHLIPKSVLEARDADIKFVSDKIDNRVSQGSRNDFLDQVLKHPLLSAHDVAHIPPTNLTGMSLEELKVNASIIALAGSETTATLLSGTLNSLLLNPRVLNKLTTDIRSTFSAYNGITIASASSVLYLRHVLDEALRFYNPAPFVSGRLVPPGGRMVSSHYHPGGTGIHVCAHAAYRSPHNFARPDEFIPERWTNPKPDEFMNDNRDNVFQPFSYGPRNCIGRNLAYAEMRILLAKFLWRFDITVPEGREEECRTWVERQRTWIIWEKMPLWVDVREREVE